MISLPTQTPLTTAPVFARDVKELETVISAQDAEERSLKLRLVESNREVSFLRRRLRDSSDELEVTAEATLNAAERLEAHQGRQGLVLAAEAERCSAERAALEDELRRMEQLLFERDQEIARLRKAHENLQASRLEGELQLTGMAVAHEKASAEVRAFGAGVQELRDRMKQSLPLASGGGPSHAEAIRVEEVARELAAKQEERALLQMRADAVTAEAQRLEAELVGMREHVRQFEMELRKRQEMIENYDHRLVREAAAIKAQCDELRHVLHNEQKDAAGIDQRAVLQERCSAESEGVRREVETILTTVRGLAATLRARGLSVCSPQVGNDPIDVALHVFLRNSGFPPMGGPGQMMGRSMLPPVVWRLLPGEYLVDEDRVAIFERNGHLMVRGPRGGEVGIQQFMLKEGSRVHMDFAGALGATS